MMHLHRIDRLIGMMTGTRITVVVDELSANFEKHFDTVNEEKDENDEQ